ncbi:MAG TPA: FAD-binding oxidoreductase [Candidatus Binataceae bacterium]|nr:FAD-binding oxidoreductase [Candidatus Binataceae bacterium]
MQNRSSVVIAGGGVIGSACAYFLRRDPGFKGSITIVEPDPTYRFAASARSASSIRRQFSTPVNVAISEFGIEFLRQADRGFSRGGPPGQLGLVESTYLYLATAAGRAALAGCAAIQTSAGVSVRLHDRESLAARYPWLHTEDLAAGSDTASGEGWFDGYALLSALRKANERDAVVYLRDRVVSFERSADGSIVAAHLEQRGRVACAVTVMAVGTRARELAATVDLDLPVYPRKRCVFVFTCPTVVRDCPLVIDPSGLWFRPDGTHFLCGLPAEPDPNVSTDDFEVEHALFDERAWPILAHRVPAFEAIRLTGSWAGHYDYNIFDQNAFVGPIAGVPNLLIASGFSGHGLQQAPAIGRGIAETIVHGGYRSLDLEPLAYGRYLSGAPLREANII